MHAVTRVRNYDHDEAEIRGAWHASIGATSEEEIRKRSACAAPIAYRIASLRRAGGLRPITLWLEGALTLRQLERIVTTAPFDEASQLDGARHASATARALLAR